MKSIIAFDEQKIYTSLKLPDYNPNDHKLSLLIELTNELGKFGYIIDQNALPYLSECDIINYHKNIIPILYKAYYTKIYNNNTINISIEEWKSRRKEPWIDNFYLSGDFRFISRSAELLGLHVKYLDRLNDTDLHEIYKKLIESEELSLVNIETLKYLAGIYKYESDIIPGNEISELIVGLYNKNYRPTLLSSYIKIKPNRKERRLILEKLEKEINLNKESRTDLKKLFKILHPEEYKKLFPKVWSFVCKKKYENKDDNPYSIAKELLDSERKDEFVSKFICLLCDSNEDEKSDLMTLLYSNKLNTCDLLNIYKNIQKKELGLYRIYINPNYSDFGVLKIQRSGFKNIISIIPTIKEFLINKISLNIKDNSLSGKTIYIDPELKDYDFDSVVKRIKPELIGKLDKSDKEIKIITSWNSNNVKFSDLVCYIWKGCGKQMKRIVGVRGNSSTSITKVNICKLKDLGYKYLTFNNRLTNYNKRKKHSMRFDIFSINENHPIISKNINSNQYRNNFGGLIDLNTLDIWMMDFDLSTIPTINGNTPEAILRYIIPEFRLSAYDLVYNFFKYSGSTILETNENCDIEFKESDYKQFKLKLE